MDHPNLAGVGRLHPSSESHRALRCDARQWAERPPTRRHRRGGQAWSQTPRPRRPARRRRHDRGPAAAVARRDLREPSLGDGEVEPCDQQAGEGARGALRRRGSTTARAAANPARVPRGPPTPRARPGRPSTSPAARAAPSAGRPVARAWTVEGCPTEHAGHRRGNDDLPGRGNGSARAAQATARHGLLPARGQIVGTSSCHRASRAWSPTTSTPASAASWRPHA